MASPSSLSRTPVAIDLFAGGGGLSLGLKQAGFLVSGAVEIDRDAAKTYAANHAGTVLFQQDISTVSGSELIRTSPNNSIDLISACPPCQGFSSLTSKYRRHDPRNDLIFEFVRIVGEIRPQLIMMENVPGLAMKGAPLFDRALAMLAEHGYMLSWDVVEAADYGIPQRRRRLVLLGSTNVAVPIPRATHKWNAKDGEIPWVTVRDEFGKFKLGPVITLKQSFSQGGPKCANWHVVRNISIDNKKRLRVTRGGASRAVIPPELRPNCHKSTDKGFVNVYGRMSWNKPSPTITGGCTTLSKGRFGHPDRMRTISVREAAILQTFPADYLLETSSMESACRIVGNALPPKFAAIMASACREVLIR